MQKDGSIVSDMNDLSAEPFGAEAMRFVEGSPEIRGLLEHAGAALVDGDFESAQKYTNKAWAYNDDIPKEAAPLIEIASAVPYLLHTKQRT